MPGIEMVKNNPKSRPDVPNTIWRWKNRDYSYTLARAIGESAFGGGDLTEIELALKGIRVGNPESWYQNWDDMADNVEEIAHNAEQNGDLVTSRDAYLRACTYYRLADHYLYPDDPRRLEMNNPFSRSVVCFERASKNFWHGVEKVQIGIEGGSLPAYLFTPRAPGRSPALIFLNDFDTTKEEQYFALGRAAVERGISCLCIDAPGQGEALRTRGMKFTLASETFLPAIVNFLRQRSEIESDKIGLIGWGLGGYMAARAAAYEKRLSFCFVWSALVDVESVFDSLYRLLSRESLVNTLFAMGFSDMREGKERLKGLRLNEDIVRQIRCPVFILHGRDDNLLGVEQAEALYNMVDAQKNMVIVEPAWGIGGILHNQVDNLHVAHQVIFPKVMKEFGMGVIKERMAA
ncbi:MAG: alpha/beta fold hydrolase [Actinobacteria bacterium]|nr:alpha/beta fold hydrolase [Actinomycetota bacterium]